MNNLIAADSFTRRSLLYRKLGGASFTEVGDGATVSNFDSDPDKVRRCGLLDLSLHPRVAYRGRNTSALLEAAGLPVPISPNQAKIGPRGELVLRLGQNEFWVLADPTEDGASVDVVKKIDLPETACYQLYCQDSHAWLALTGAHLPEIMAKICGVDLRDEAFALGAIAQTSVARVNVIVVHHEVNAIPCFLLLCDSAAVEYFWECLLDASAEFGGGV